MVLIAAGTVIGLPIAAAILWFVATFGRFILFVGILLLLGFGSGRQHWPAEFMADFDYYSTDLSPVAVTLRNPNDPDSLHRTVLNIPRAAIVFANNYHPRKQPKLPDAIETDHIQIALAYPDGKPLITYALEMAAAQHINIYEAMKRARSDEFVAQIYYSAPDNPWEARVRESQAALLKVKDTYEGMLHAPADYYIGEAGVDEFVEIYCYPEATPIYFCGTKMRVSPSITAEVSFVDFRFHGGRAYVNERARKFREAVCRFIVPSC